MTSRSHKSSSKQTSARDRTDWTYDKDKPKHNRSNTGIGSSKEKQSSGSRRVLQSSESQGNQGVSESKRRGKEAARNQRNVHHDSALQKADESQSSHELQERPPRTRHVNQRTHTVPSRPSKEDHQVDVLHRGDDTPTSSQKHQTSRVKSSSKVGSTRNISKEVRQELRKDDISFDDYSIGHKQHSHSGKIVPENSTITLENTIQRVAQPNEKAAMESSRGAAAMVEAASRITLSKREREEQLRMALQKAEKESQPQQKSVENSDVRKSQQKQQKKGLHQRTLEGHSSEEQASQSRKEISTQRPRSRNVQETDCDEDDYGYENEEFEEYDYEDDFDEDEDEDEDEKQENILDNTDSRWSSASSNKLPGPNDSSTRLFSASKLDPFFDSELNDVLDAVRRENTQTRHGKRVSGKELIPPSTQTTYSMDDGTEFDTLASPPATMDFSKAAKKMRHTKAGNRTVQRFKALSSMIQLDISSYSIFDLAPVSAYELYIRSFGNKRHTQTATQCTVQSAECGIQTLEIETSECWTQYPPSDLKGYGRIHADKQTNSVKDTEYDAFVLRAGRLCLAILSEETSASNHDDLMSSVGEGLTQRFPKISTSTVCIAADTPIFAGRHVCYVATNHIQTNLLLTAYSKAPIKRECECNPSRASSSGSRIYSPHNFGIVALWDLTSPSAPSKVLVCQGQPTSCCFIGKDCLIAAAGKSDGAVVIWDLRDKSPSHAFKTSQPLYLPSFSSEGALESNVHRGPIMQLTPVPSISSIGTLQFLSLDNGLRPGSRVKLLRSGYIDTFHKDRASDMTSTSCAIHPLHPGHVLIGTNHGHILHRTRHGQNAAPTRFNLGEFPLLRISASIMPIAGLWSNCRPSVFYIYSSEELQVWDILKDESSPRESIAFKATDTSEANEVEQNDNIARKALAATSIALLPHQSSLKRKLLIANAAGAVTLHQLTSSWTQSDDNELHNFKSWLNLLIADRI